MHIDTGGWMWMISDGDHWMMETGVSLRMTHHHHGTIVNVQEGRYLTGLTRARTSLFTVYPGGGWESSMRGS